MKQLILFAILAVSLSFQSCQKDNITQVIGGNADMSTIDFSVLENEWDEYGTFGTVDYVFAVDLAIPEITDNVIANGMVNLYRKEGDTWVSIPTNIFYQNGGALYQGMFIYRMKRGLFSIEYYESDFKTVRPGTQYFRLVIVQPY